MADGGPKVCEFATPEIGVKILDGVIADYEEQIAEEAAEKAAAPVEVNKDEIKEDEAERIKSEAS